MYAWTRRPIPAAILCALATLPAAVRAQSLAFQAPCPNGPVEAARRTAAALPRTMPADLAALQNSLGIAALDAASALYPTTGRAVPANDPRLQGAWDAWLGPELVWKHEALCSAGDAMGGNQLLALRRSWRQSKRTALAVGIGGSIAWTAAVVGFYHAGHRAAVIGGGVVGMSVGSLFFYRRGERAKRRYFEEPPPAYAAGIFAAYNSALRIELEQRAR